MEQDILKLKEELQAIDRKPITPKSIEETDKFVRDLMEKMTVQEKIGQLFQTSYDGAAISGPSFDSSRNKELITSGKVGSLLGLTDTVTMYNFQKLAVEKSRLGIPLFFGNDIIHGCKTMFPQNLAMSGSFNPELIEETCKVAAFESAHNGITMTYSPMLDTVRDPRWGRVTESCGEDPYLASLIAKAYVNGYQQNDLTSYDTIGACAKHFIGYGQAEAGREYNTVDMSERMLRQFYLPPFKVAVEAGVQSVMTSFNVYDGIPATSNKFLLRKVLKGELGFNGFVISDYTSSGEIINHKVAKDEKDVAKKCIKAGLDHEMMSQTYIKYLEELLEEGSITIDLIEDACYRVLKYKYDSGLFDNPYKNMYAYPSEFELTDHAHQVALDMCHESIVLLKNDNQILPLNTKNIALVGPLAKENKVIGAWGGQGRNEDCVTLFDGLVNKFGSEITIHYAMGSGYHENTPDSILEAVEAAKKSDVIIAAMGEQHWMAGEANSRANIDVPAAQLELLRELRKLNKPIVFVLFTGRPLDLRQVIKNSDAVLNTWFLGTESGNAIANTLFGDNNPNARLTMSFPYCVGQIPVYHNMFNTGRPNTLTEDYVSKYRDIPNEPLFCFGYGLSYSTFDYTNIEFNQTDEDITISFDVTNTSDFSGYEVSQVYIEATSFSVTRPLNELKGFTKTFLEANETKHVSIKVKKKDFAYYNEDMELIVENNDYKIKLSKDSATVIACSTINWR